MNREERLKYDLVNKLGITLCTVDKPKDLGKVVEKWNARKRKRDHVHHVVQIREFDIPVAEVTKNYFMGSTAWVREVQKGLYVDSYFDDERYTPIVIGAIGDVDAKRMAEMIIQRLEVECGEVMGESFLYLEEYDCIVRTGDTFHEKIRNEEFSGIMAMPAGERRDEAFDRYYRYGNSHERFERHRIDGMMEDLVMNGYVSTGKVGYNSRLMDRIKREYPNLTYEFTEEDGVYGIRVVDQDRRIG